MTEKRSLTFYKIGIYLIIFFAVWSVRELVLQPVFLDPLDDIVSEVLATIIKLSVWTLPAVLLINYFQDDMWIGLREMFTTKPKLLKDAPILALVILVPPLQALIFTGELTVSPDFAPLD